MELKLVRNVTLISILCKTKDRFLKVNRVKAHLLCPNIMLLFVFIFSTSSDEIFLAGRSVCKDLSPSLSLAQYSKKSPCKSSVGYIKCFHTSMCKAIRYGFAELLFLTQESCILEVLKRGINRACTRVVVILLN